MGRRGRLPGSSYGLQQNDPKKALAVVDDDDEPTTPAAPTHLGELGRSVWELVFSEGSWLTQGDQLAVLRLAETAQLRQKVIEAIDSQGILLERRIVAYGRVTDATELFANPALRELQRLDQTMAELTQALGLSPAARARLGVSVSTTELRRAEMERLLSGMQADYAKKVRGE